MPVSYFLETPRDPVDRGGALWKKPLPMAPLPAPAAAPDSGTARFCYGDYFDAVHRFLVRGDCRLLNQAVARHLGKSVDPIGHIGIFLVKHGEFYHPAKIEVRAGKRRLNFVLNVAVSDAGRSCLAGEIDCLTRLGSHPAAGYIPRVYGKGQVNSPAARDLMMWLGDWFEDFHEFHWTGGEPDGEMMLAIWDPQTGKRFLDEDQTGCVYRRAAAILTRFFDLTTFEQIHPWHHAAGDFVVRQLDDNLEVRLITVRGYTPMLASAPKDQPAPDLHLTLQMMLLFLIRLTLRMRLDRMDGVGDPVWADEALVRYTVDGFRSAMAEKSQPAQLPDAPLVCFDAYTSQCTRSDLQELVAAMAAAYPKYHPEKTILERAARSHADVLFRALADRSGLAVNTTT